MSVGSNATGRFPLGRTRSPLWSENRPDSNVLNLKFGGLQIDSMIADSPDFGEDWRWVDALRLWN